MYLAEFKLDGESVFLNLERLSNAQTSPYNPYACGENHSGTKRPCFILEIEGLKNPIVFFGYEMKLAIAIIHEFGEWTRGLCLPVRIPSP